MYSIKSSLNLSKIRTGQAGFDKVQWFKVKELEIVGSESAGLIKIDSC